MAEIDRKIEELRNAWHKATEKSKPQDAIKALLELERIQPSEAQWSQRLGEAYRRTNNRKEAVDAFVRAFERYNARGFIPRAVAMAKLVATMDKERGNLLESSLPKEGFGPVLTRPPPADTTKPSTGPAVPRPPLVPPGPLPVSSHAPMPPKVPALSLSKPVRPIPLTPAPDRGADEVRFSDSQDASISVLLEDFSQSSVVDSKDIELIDDSLPPTESASGLILEDASIDTYAKMATFRLFAALGRDALIDLAAAAELVEFVPSAMVIIRDEKAFALFAILSGTARVSVPGNPEIRLVEGDIFGESSLLDEGTRQADVKAETPLMCLRIDKKALETAMSQHPELEDALFDLLARRLVTNLMNTSPLFQAFDQQGRLDLAQRFEVRRASPGTVIAEKGRRSDGLYVILAGNVMSEGDGAGSEFRIARGTAFGHASLMGGKSDVTIRAATEAVLLRMPASGFAALAAQYPPVLAYLSETANDPLPMSRR
ncbi:MAG: cyclic nucleotide-binding domain-containing protein [Labilithrix sp.]